MDSPTGESWSLSEEHQALFCNKTHENTEYKTRVHQHTHTSRALKKNSESNPERLTFSEWWQLASPWCPVGGCSAWCHQLRSHWNESKQKASEKELHFITSTILADILLEKTDKIQTMTKHSTCFHACYVKINPYHKCKSAVKWLKC